MRAMDEIAHDLADLSAPDRTLGFEFDRALWCPAYTGTSTQFYGQFGQDPTGSLDRALHLLRMAMPLAIWSISQISHRMFEAHLSLNDGTFLGKPETEAFGNGPTPAIALCLAMARMFEKASQ